MKGRNIFQAMNGLDPDLILQAAPGAEGQGRRTKMWWIPLVAVLLCTAIVGGAICLPMLLDTQDPSGNDPPSSTSTDEPLTPDEPYVLPAYNDAYLSAEDIAGLFPDHTDLESAEPINAYKKVCHSGTRPMVPEPVPTGEYANIYRIEPLSKELSSEEANALLDRVASPLMEALGQDIASFEKRMFSYDENIRVSYDKKINSDQYNYSLSVNQLSGGITDYGYVQFSRNIVSLIASEFSKTIDGRTVQVDRRQNDEEILASLAWVRDRLLEVFGREFDSAKVEYDYDAKSFLGIKNIRVYYYNSADGIDGVNMGDYLELEFEGSQSVFHEDTDPIISRCYITYCEFRQPMKDCITVEAEGRLIPLAEAEKMLENGYVFGGHFCELCMESQEKIAFDSYDYVGLEYVISEESMTPRAVPFYVFYKKIDTYQNGNVVYAKTYVCAVEVSGLSEYFEDQKKDHPDTDVSEPQP